MPRRKQVNPKPLKRQREEAEELLRKVNETSAPTTGEEEEEVKKGKGEELKAAGKPDPVNTQLPKRQRIGTRSASKDGNKSQQATKTKKVTPKVDSEVTKSSQNGMKAPKKTQGKGRGKGRGRGQRQPKAALKLPSPKANNHDENSLDQFELADEDSKSGKEVEKEIVEKPKSKTVVSEKPSSKRTKEPMKSSPEGNNSEVVAGAQTEPEEQTNMTDSEMRARNEALEALLQITDSELNKMDRSPGSGQPPFPPQVTPTPAQQPAGQRSHPVESPAVVTMPTGVLRAVHDGRGDVQYQVRPESVEQQALKLLYTKQSGGVESHMLYRASKMMGKTELMETMKQEELAKQDKKQKKAGRHVCPYCGRGCAKPSVLKKHIRSHTGERPYPCVPCGFAFKTKSNLYKHRKSHAHALKAGLVTNPDGSKIEAMDDIIDDGVDTTDSEDDSDETAEGKISEGTDHAQKLLVSNMQIPSSYAMPVHMSVSSAGNNTDDPGLSEGLASKMRVPYPTSQPSQSQPMYFVPGREGSQVQMHPDKFVLIQPAVSQVQGGLPVNMPVHMRPAVQTLAQTVRERLAAKSQENLADKSRQEALRQRRMAISNLSPLPPLKTSNFGGNMMSLSMSSLPDVGQQSTPTSMVPRQQAVRTLPSPLTPGSKSVSMSNVTSKDSSQQTQRSLDRESLHERIMQLINQNEAIVESQSLENVKPRRMSGSRRSSIESPKPTSMGYLDLMKKSSPEVSQQLNSQSIQGRRGSLGNLSEMQTLGAGIPPMTPVTTISFSLSPSPSMGLVAIATTAPASPLVTTGFMTTPPSNGSSGGSSPVVQLPTRPEALPFQMTKKVTDKETSEKWSGPQGKLTEPQFTGPLVPINVNSIQTSLNSTSTAAVMGSVGTQGGLETGSSMIKELLLSRGRIQTEIKKSTERDLPKHPTYANPLELQTSVRMIQKEDRVLHSPKKRKLYEEMQAKAQRQAMASLQQGRSQATIEGPPLKIFLEEGRVLSPNVRENSPHYATSATNMAARPSEGSSTPLETTSSQPSSNEPGQQVHSNYDPAIQKEAKDQQGEKTMLYAKSDTFSQLPSEKLPPKKKLLYTGMHSPNPEARLAMGESSSGVQTSTSKQVAAADVKKVSGDVLQPLQSLYRLANIKDPPAAFMTKPDVSAPGADPHTAVPSSAQAVERDKEVSASAVRPEQLTPPVSQKGSSLGNEGQLQKGHVPTAVSGQSLQSVGTEEHKVSSSLLPHPTGQQSHQAVTLDKVVTVPAAGQHYALLAANDKRARAVDVGQLSSPPRVPVTQEKKSLPQSLSHPTQSTKEGVVGTAPFIQSTAQRHDAGQQGKTAGFQGPPGQLTPYTGQLAVQFSQQTAQGFQKPKHHTQPGQVVEPYSQQHAVPSNMQNQLKKSPSEEQILHSRGQQSQTRAHPPEELHHDRQSNPPRADPNTSTRHRVPYVTFERGKENIVVINVPAPAPPREIQSMKLEQTGNIIKANIMPGAGGQQRMLVQMAVPLGGQTVPTNQSSVVSLSMQGIGMGQRQQKVAMARAQMQGAAIKPDQFGKTVEVMASLQPVALLTFCTLHRPQPIHLEQGSNQTISMYAKWNIVPSSIDVRSNLSLYNSQVNKWKYRRGITTIANSTQPRGGILTPSSFWSSRHKVKVTQQALQVKGQAPQPTKEEIATQAGEGATAESDVSDSRKKLKEAIRAKNEPLRVKIFDGGFKSNEEYVYVRGRGRGKYVCEDCGIRCKKPSMLKKHIRTHTDVRPYHCKYCNFSFKTKGNLTKHMKSKAHSKKCLETGVPVEDGAVDDTGEETASSTGQDAGVEEHQFSDAETTDSAEDEETESENENEDEDEEEEVVEIKTGDSGMSQSGVTLSSSSIQAPGLFSMYPHSLSVSSIGLSTIYGKSVSLSQNATPLASPPASLPAPEELSKTVQKTVRDLEGKEDGPKGQESGRPDLLAEALKAQTKPATVPPPLMMSSTQPGMGFWGLTQSLKQPQTSVVPPTSFQLPPPQPPEQRTPEKPTSSTPQVSSPLPPVLTPQKMFPQGPPLPSPLLLSPPPLLDKHGYVTSQIISANQPLPGQKVGKTATPQKLDVISVRNQIIPNMPVVTVAEEKVLQKEHSMERKPSSSHTQCKQVPYQVTEPDRQADRHHTQVQVKKEPTESKVKVETADQPNQSERGTVDAVPQHENLSSRKDADAMHEREKQIEGEAQEAMHTNIQGGDSSQAKAVVRKDGQVEEIHTCHLCKRAFQWGRMLKEHMRAHVEERPFTCKECAVSFRTKGHLSKHERSQTHHLKVEADAQFMEWNEVEVVDSTNDPRPFKCKECKVAFRIPGHLAKHLRSKGHAYAVERQERILQLDGSSSVQISPGTVKTGLHQNTGEVGVGTLDGTAGRELVQHGDSKPQTSPLSSKTTSETQTNIGLNKEAATRGRIRSISETEAEKLGREKHMFERFTRERTISETEAYAPQMRVAAGMVPLQVSTTSMAPAPHYILPQTSGQVLQQLPGIMYAQTQPVSPRLAKTHIPIQPALPTNSPGVRAVMQPSLAIVPQMMATDGKTAIVGTPVSMPSTLPMQPLLIPQEQARNQGAPGQPQILPRMTAPGLLMPVPPQHHQTPSPAVPSTAGAQHRLQMISLTKGPVPFIVTAPPISPISPGTPSSVNVHGAPPSSVLANISPGSYSPQSSDLAARTCPHCNRSFKSARYVSKHIQTRHSGVKNFKCPYEGCDKEYAIKESYKYHISTHERNSNRQAALEQEEKVQRQRTTSEQTDSSTETVSGPSMEKAPESLGEASAQSVTSQPMISVRQEELGDKKGKIEEPSAGKDTTGKAGESTGTDIQLRIDEHRQTTGEQNDGVKELSSEPDDTKTDCDNLTTLESVKETDVLTKSSGEKEGFMEETGTSAVPVPSTRGQVRTGKQGVETRRKRKLREQVTVKHGSPKTRKKESAKGQQTNTTPKKLSEKKRLRTEVDSTKGSISKTKSSLVSRKLDTQISEETQTNKQPTESLDGNVRKVEETESKLQDKEEQSQS